MTDRTFTFTIKQIKEIYQAGIKRGEVEASAYEWGTRPNGEEYDECISVIDDIVNKDIKWSSKDHIEFSTIESWFKESK